MNRYVLIAGAFIALTGYVAKAHDPQDPGGRVTTPTTQDCSDHGRVDVRITYGESEIAVDPRVHVRHDGKLVFALAPRRGSANNVNYDEVVIHIIGKNNRSSWLNKSVAANDANSNRFAICVEGIEPGTYEYQVIVPGVGVIDPRIIVDIPDPLGTESD